MPIIISLISKKMLPAFCIRLSVFNGTRTELRDGKARKVRKVLSLSDHLSHGFVLPQSQAEHNI